MSNFQLYYGENKLIRWNDDDVRFLLDQHAELDFHNASGFLKQQSTGRHVSTLGHIILIIPSQTVFGLIP
jgi:hypothetical protein